MAVHVFCRHAYILNRKSAKEYLSIVPMYEYGDVMINNFFEKKVVTHPSIFYQNEKKSTLDRNQYILKILQLDGLDNSGLDCITDILTYKPVQRIRIMSLLLIIMIIIAIVCIKFCIKK